MIIMGMPKQPQHQTDRKAGKKNIYKNKKKTYVETKRSTSYESFDS